MALSQGLAAAPRLAARLESLPAALYTAAGVRALDRTAIETHGVAGYELMQRAAAAAYRVLRLRWPAARRLSIYCGTGNNGGDGFVLARLAKIDGLDVELGLQGEVEAIRGDAARARDDWLAAGGRIRSCAEVLRAPTELIVDALLGTGLERDLQGEWARLVIALREAAAPVLAMDIPTGLNADTGRIMGEALPAAATVTFIGLKQGLFTAQGPDLCGQLVFSDLGVGDRLDGAVPASAGLLPQGLPPGLPPRQAAAHKGSFGHLLLVGGGRGMAGAARLAGEAALRSGAGLVSLAVHPDSLGLGLTRPELMVHGATGVDQLEPLLQRADLLAIGPGLGRDAWGESMAAALLSQPQPSVVDADGLYWLARLGGRRDDRVITPHPGEAARLLGTDIASVQADRFAAARELVGRFGGVVVLKGAGSIVASAERCWVNSSGHAGMASAGSGDVLTGIIAALMAQGLAPAAAACHGVWRHGLAAQRLVEAGRPLPAGELAAGLSGLDPH